MDKFCHIVKHPVLRQYAKFDENLSATFEVIVKNSWLTFSDTGRVQRNRR